MNATGIDRLLYGGGQEYNRSRLPDAKQIEEAAKNNQSNGDFRKAMMDKIRKKNVPASINLSSSQIHRGLTRSEVKDLVRNNSEARKLYEASLEFEAYFVEQMFREMKKNVPKNQLINGGRAEEIFDDMLLTERVRDVSRQSEFGLAESMFQQLQGL